MWKFVCSPFPHCNLIGHDEDVVSKWGEGEVVDCIILHWIEEKVFGVIYIYICVYVCVYELLLIM